MDTPTNLGPSGPDEHRIRAVYSNLTRAISSDRENDSALTDAQIIEAIKRLAAKYEQAD